MKYEIKSSVYEKYEYKKNEEEQEKVKIVNLSLRAAVRLLGKI